MARLALGGGTPKGSESAVLALLRASLALLGTAFVLVALLYSGYLNYTDLDGPDVEVAAESFEVSETGRELRYGRSHLTRDGKIWRLHLAGSPEQIGDARGRLTARLFEHLDRQVQERIDERYGAWLEGWTASMLTRWDYRDADRHLGDAYRRELAAMAAAMPEAQTGRASAYHRLFLYQGFDSLVARLDDVVIEGAAFAVVRKKSGAEPGNLLVGRTLWFDLEHDAEPDRVLTVVRPDGRYPFVSIGWAGLLGVVTGVNSRGIFVALDPARTDDPLEDGAPLPIALRRVLEEADTLEHAVEILRAAELRTSGIVLVADGPQRKAVVVELGARDREDRRVVRGEDESTVWATDHLLREPFEGDLQNDWVRRYSSSGYRYDRLGELLAQGGDVDPARVVSILRDRRGLDHAELGLGNPNALENLRIAQAVVLDASAMVLWVCEGPSALGRFKAFDLSRLLGREDAPAVPLDDLPADPLLYSEEYRDWLEATDAIEHARELLNRGYPDRALVSAQIAHALAPDVGELHRLLGDISRELGDTDEAIVHYRRYLELVPGRRREQNRVEGIIAELGG
ncbi:MAG TPA: C45 family peptidase [Nannocystaceae bacterium]|nr:C45 family peptidase [Nannocystaceae bacterium]